MKIRPFVSKLFSFSTLLIIITAGFNTHSSTLFRQFSSFTTVSGIVSDGSNLWIATSGGAVKYTLASGAKKVFTDLTDLPDLNLVGAVQDRSGIIWFGSAEGYLIRLDPATESFTSFNALAVAGWPMTCMMYFKDNIFIGTPNGLSIFSIKKSFMQNIKSIGTFSSVDVSALRSYGDTLALVTGDGIAYCVSQDVALTIFSDPKLWTCIPADNALGIIHGNDSLKASGYKSLETGTTVWQYGVGNFLVKNGSIAASFNSPVTCLLPLDNNSFAVGTQSSFFWIYNGLKISYSQVTVDGPAGSTNGGIGGCVLDRSGLLWYVPQDLTSGFGWFDGSTWTNLTNANTPGLGLTSGLGALGTKNSIMSTSKNDIWISIYSGGVKWLNRDNSAWSSYIDSASPFYTLPSPLVRFDNNPASWWTLVSGTCEDSLGYIWVANSNAYNGNFLHVRKPRDNIWRSFSTNDSSFSSLSTYTGPIAAGMDKVSGKQYVYLGFWNYNTKIGEGVTVISYGLQGNPLTDTITVIKTPFEKQIAVFDIAVANDSLVWIASLNGIYKMTHNDPATLTKIDTITSTDPFFAVAAGYDGKAIFCKDRDLYAYSDADRSLTKLTSKGKFGSAVNSIILDKKSSVYWIASNKGLFRFDSGDSSAAIAGIKAIDVYPNPISRKRFLTGHVVYFAGLNSVSPNVRIFDAGGTLVKNFSAKNTKLLEWNGANQSGMVVIPGVYFYQAQAGNGKRCKGKIFILP